MTQEQTGSSITHRPTKYPMLTAEQQVALLGVTERAFIKILGQEIRVARETRHWTRAQVIAHMPSGIADRTLLAYEHGTRLPPLPRLMEFSVVVGTTASAILDRTTAKITNLHTSSLSVHLRDVAADQQPGFEHVRQWAAARSKDDTNELLLVPAMTHELAYAFDLTPQTLAAYLAEFTGRNQPNEE